MHRRPCFFPSRQSDVFKGKMSDAESEATQNTTERKFNTCNQNLLKRWLESHTATNAQRYFDAIEYIPWNVKDRNDQAHCMCSNPTCLYRARMTSQHMKNDQMQTNLNNNTNYYGIFTQQSYAEWCEKHFKQYFCGWNSLLIREVRKKGLNWQEVYSFLK